MRLLIVSGMLGSGKTSAILRIASILSDKGLSIAIIENEIGSVGIDGEILERHGLEVKELKGGCICCSMRTGMIDTLRTLEAHVKPDIAIIEPTGIADPKQVLTAVDGVTGLTVSSIFTIIMVDAERILKVRKMFERPLRNQLSVANLVLVNKTDTVPDAEADEIEAFLRSMHYDGPILRAQADTGKSIDKAAEMIF
jgi:G3E family GTPase